MCGIFGMVLQDGALSRERRTVGATLLAAFNEQRGDDSWGMAGWRQGKPVVEHGMYSPVDGALQMAAQTAWIGHARFATVGDKTLENSHPFRFGTIIGAHNGGIYNHKEIAAEYKRDFAVDSMHIFAHLAEGRKTDELEGYGAIEYLREDAPDEAFLCQMRNGDLCVLGIGTGKHPRGVLWSSDSVHAWDVVGAIGVSAFEYKLEEGTVYRATRTGLYVTPHRVVLKPLTCTPTVPPYTWQGGDWSESGKWNKRQKYRYRKAKAGFNGSGHHLGDAAYTIDHAYDRDNDPDTPSGMLVDAATVSEEQFLEWCDDMMTGCNQWLDPDDPDVRKAYLEWVAKKQEGK